MPNPLTSAWRMVRVGAAHLLSVPIYLAYEGFVRLINPSTQPLPSSLRDHVAPYFTDIDLGSVRIVSPARIPSGHAGLTLGSRIFLAHTPLVESENDMRLLIHELVHVRQRMRFGRFAMMRRYGVEWARVLSYSDHRLEVEARQFEQWTTERLKSRPEIRP